MLQQSRRVCAPPSARQQDGKQKKQGPQRPRHTCLLPQSREPHRLCPYRVLRERVGTPFQENHRHLAVALKGSRVQGCPLAALGSEIDV